MIHIAEGDSIRLRALKNMTTEEYYFYVFRRDKYLELIKPKKKSGR